MKSSDGFTLLELLVAITIFSLVIGMAMFSLRYSFGMLRHLDAPFAEDTQRLCRLRDCIASTFFYVTEQSDLFNSSKSYRTLFIGDPDSMTFVSVKPPSATGPALCRLFKRDDTLLLEESPLYGEGSNYRTPLFTEKGRSETVIMTQVIDLKLEYFQQETMLTSLRDDIPGMVRLSVTTDTGTRELFIRIPADFNDKKRLFQATHENS